MNRQTTRQYAKSAERWATVAVIAASISLVLRILIIGHKWGWW